MTGIRFELISVELCDFASSALWNDVSARIFECRQKSPAAFVHNPVCMCTAAHPLQIHTPLQTCTFYVSECICFLSPGPHCIKVCCSSATLSFCYHCSYRGSLSKKKASLSCSFSQQAPPPVLLQHLLPLLLAFAKTTVNQAKQGWCKSVKMCLPIAETAGRRSLMGEKTQALN